MGNDDGIIDEGLQAFADRVFRRQIDIVGEFIFEKILKKNLVFTKLGC